MSYMSPFHLDSGNSNKVSRTLWSCQMCGWENCGFGKELFKHSLQIKLSLRKNRQKLYGNTYREIAAVELKKEMRRVDCLLNILQTVRKLTNNTKKQ